jgi:N-glycosidase YbiA
MAIKFYKIKDPHGYMSNYKKARFFIYGRWWNWVEAPYQAQKTFVPEEYDAIHQATTNNESRLLGQKVTMRPDWDQVKRQVMKECVLAKFLQHKDLRDQLMATGDEELIEDSPIDYYWGCGADGSGQNVLGQVLMEVRQELRGE